MPYGGDIDEDYHSENEGDKHETWVAGWGATEPNGKYLMTFHIYFFAYI